MQITAADIDRLNPPTDAADLIRLAADHGHQMWVNRETARSGRDLFQLRITGPGWDLIIAWTSRNGSAPDLASVLLWQDTTHAWTTLPTLNDARARITTT